MLVPTASLFHATIAHYTTPVGVLPYDLYTLLFQVPLPPIPTIVSGLKTPLKSIMSLESYVSIRISDSFSWRAIAAAIT